MIELLRECREIVDRHHEMIARWLRNGAGIDKEFDRVGDILKRLDAALASLSEEAEMLEDPRRWAREWLDYIKALRSALERATARAEASERDAGRYRWLRSTADLRFDCGGWAISFDNWLLAQGEFTRTPDDAPISCEPLIVDAAIDTALDAAGRSGDE